VISAGGPAGGVLQLGQRSIKITTLYLSNDELSWSDLNEDIGRWLRFHHVENSSCLLIVNANDFLAAGCVIVNDRFFAHKRLDCYRKLPFLYECSIRVSGHE
jgi:hypothetical protein